MLDDFVKILFILISVVYGESYTISTKSTSSSNSMQVSVWIWAIVDSWHIKVYNQLSLLNIDTSSNQISCDQYIYLLLSEFLHYSISLLFF